MTMVSDPETGLTLHMATISLDSLADSELAESIWQSDDRAIDGLQELGGEGVIDFTPLDWDLHAPSFFNRDEYLQSMLNEIFVSTLGRDPNIGPMSHGQVAALLEELLDAPVLTEHSPAEAAKAFSVIAGATVAGTAKVLAAVISAGGLNGMGMAIAILAPTGILLLGTAATLVVLKMLLTKSRQEPEKPKSAEHGQGDETTQGD